jgi:hypothetical protein
MESALLVFLDHTKPLDKMMGYSAVSYASLLITARAFLEVS